MLRTKRRMTALNTILLVANCSRC